jgi:hypothetical protein
MVDESTQNNETIAEGSPNPDLNINDLNALKSIIDVASARGAFKPNEMVPVGTVYGKLEAFLNAASQATAAAQAKTDA